MNIRQKGQNGEREACALLTTWTGIELTRSLEQTRSGGSDIRGINGLCIEVKRCETLTINRWWSQVERAADNEGCIPVLMYRRNRERWSFCIPAYLLVIGMQGYITLGESVFREWLNSWLK